MLRRPHGCHTPPGRRPATPLPRHRTCTRLPWFPGWLDDRIRHWTSQAKTLLSAEDATVVDSHLTALTMIGITHGVPCHLDFQPRNWLVDESGNLSAYRLRARAHRPARPRLRAPAIPGLAIPPRPARRFLRRIRAPPHRCRRRTGLAPRRARCTHGAGTRAPDWRPCADCIRGCHAPPSAREAAMNPAAARILDQLRTPDRVGRDLALLRTRLYRFSGDLRWYVLAEALEEHLLAGRQPQPRP